MPDELVFRLHQLEIILEPEAVAFAKRVVQHSELGRAVTIRGLRQVLALCGLEHEATLHMLTNMDPLARKTLFSAAHMAFIMGIHSWPLEVPATPAPVVVN